MGTIEGRRSGRAAHLTGTLTGYAYETIPGKSIIAGATKGLDDSESSASLSMPSSEPTTLGVLALGASGLAVWKREQSVSAAREGT